MHERDNDIIKKKNRDSDGDVSGGVDGLPKPTLEPQHPIKLDVVMHACNYQRHEVDVGRSEV